MRHFVLEGIRKAEGVKERFEIPEDFSSSEFTKVPFGLFHGKPISVKVVIDKEPSDYIQRRAWHPSQKNKELKGGKILLFMTASGRRETKAWILNFGPKGEVLTPQPLRKEIKDDLSKALAFYRSRRE